MNKTREMMQGTDKRNFQNDLYAEDLEESMEIWLLGDEQNAIDTFGEDLVASVKEELQYVQ